MSGGLIAPAGAQALMRGVAALLPAEEVVVFGGAAHAMLTPGSPPSSDIDIAVLGTHSDACACHDRLAADPACGSPAPVRPYWVHLTRALSTFDVPWSGTVLDISFMDHWPKAHFDAETVSIHYPSMTVSDPWRVLGHPVATVRLVTSVSDENPVLLLSRLLKLSAKYGLDLAADPYLATLIGQVAGLAATWAPDDDFHGRYAHLAHQRHFHGSIRRASDPGAFIRSCLDFGLMDARLAPLAAALRRDPALTARIASSALALSLDEFWAHADTLMGAAPGWREYQPTRRLRAAYHEKALPAQPPAEGTTT